VEILTDAQITDNLSRHTHVEETIRFLYTAHFSMLTNYITTNNGSFQDAQDIFQEVIVAFIRLVQQQKFRGDSSIKTFLFALNKNMWLNELKRKSRTVKREENYEKKNGDMPVDTHTAMETREARNYIIQTLDKLGESCKQILLLFYYENNSMKEIWEKTGYENEQVVRNKKYKCLKKLEELMSKDQHMLHRLKNTFND
jgi:RNA polymerase sigma factor (sigma-70 family)